ncbi:ArgR family transcriptional regulator [uncultured Parolsenella sp.]|uniref:arginine repressor n=1 Tax=uncultured Parolsenella sp. TaxID=2083008 RepID=UPI0025E6CEE9|nr:ArgR family transcriptional regulator [uncultured Parolsenella sp.]
MKRRNNRQDAIRDIVRNKSIKTQRALVEELEALGYTCTQATISRDIADMGLRKLPEGVYVLSEDLHLQRMVSELVTSVVRANNIVVIRSQAGTAQGVAAAIDDAQLPDVAGSIAGDDTIMVVCLTDEEAASLEALVNKLRNVKK